MVNASAVLEDNTFSGVPITPKVFSTSDATARLTDMHVSGLRENPFLRVKSFVNQLDGGFRGGLFMNNMAIPTAALLPAAVTFDFSYRATNRGGYNPAGSQWRKLCK